MRKEDVLKLLAEYKTNCQLRNEKQDSRVFYFEGYVKSLDNKYSKSLRNNDDQITFTGFYEFVIHQGKDPSKWILDKDLKSQSCFAEFFNKLIELECAPQSQKAKLDTNQVSVKNTDSVNNNLPQAQPVLSHEEKSNENNEALTKKVSKIELEQGECPDTFNLPKDLFLEIISNLNPREKINFGKTCRFFHFIVQDDLKKIQLSRRFIDAGCEEQVFLDLLALNVVANFDKLYENFTRLPYKFRETRVSRVWHLLWLSGEERAIEYAAKHFAADLKTAGITICQLAVVTGQWEVLHKALASTGLTESVFSPERMDGSNYSLFDFALMSNQTHMVEHFLKQGPMQNIVRRPMNNNYQLGIFSGNTELLKLTKKRKVLDHDILFTAAASGKLSGVKLAWSKHQNDLCNCEIIRAAMLGRNIEVFNYLKDEFKRKDIDVCDPEFFLSSNLLLESAFHGMPEIMRFAVANKVSVTSKKPGDYDVLHMALDSGYVNAMHLAKQLLEEAGVDLKKVMLRGGNNYLLEAIKNNPIGKEKAVDFAITELKIDPLLCNDKGENAYDLVKALKYHETSEKKLLDILDSYQETCADESRPRMSGGRI